MSVWTKLAIRSPQLNQGCVQLISISLGLRENAASCRSASTSTYSNLKHRNKGLQNGILISVRTKAMLV